MSDEDQIEHGDMRARLIGLLRSRADSIVELWTAEVTSAPYTRIADFTFPKEARAARLSSCLEALLKLAENPGDAAAREMLRVTIRGEHLRSIGLVKMVSDHHILRRILRGSLREALTADEAMYAESLIEEMVDICVEETVVIVEQYLEAQRVLTRCAWDSEGSIPDPDQTYAAFCRSAMEYFDADMVALFRLNDETREAFCIACFSKGLSLSRYARVNYGSVPLIAAAISERKPLSSMDLRMGRGQGVKLVKNMTFEHAMAIPLVKNGDATALMFVGDNARHSYYAPEEVGIADELSRLVVSALDSVDTMRKLGFRSRAQKALIDAAADMQKEIDSHEIYRILADKLVDLIPSDEVVFYVFDWARNLCNPVYSTGPYAAETMADRDFPASLGVVGAVARTRRAEIIADMETDPRGEQIPDTPATHTAMLAVPILGRKEVLGVIELMRHLPSSFSREELEIAVMFANHVAVALENAGLLNEVIRVRDEVELHIDLLTHDIANYSTPLLGYLESLKERTSHDPITLEKARIQVENISMIIAMVRTLAKLRGIRRDKLRRVDVKPSMEAAVIAIRKYSAGEKMTLSLDLPNGPMMIMADDLLPELFVNLFLTAIRTGRHEPVNLVVSASPDEENEPSWVIRVVHPQRSMPDDLKHRVMQVTKTSKSELTGGFGIGLASARGIVERYSGKMWISDVDRGDSSKGCVFNLKIPRVE
ncbi:MAG: GAF domain-containing sensor histidine kinase [Thermoplasmata archaeon]|nr:GAF domain-containing sensor histidine kinase [Thermoplasmata archaeon]